MPSLSGPRLPVELYRSILELVEYWEYRHNLRFLSYVCRAWRYEVESLMYHTVNVPAKGILYFCRTMAERPDLALRVRKLSFAADAHRKVQPGDTEFVGQTFKALVNLKDLTMVEGHDYEVREWVINHTDYSVLQDLPCKLERFVTHLWWQQEVVDFLETQPLLREFSHVGGTYAEAQPLIPDHALLQCNFLHISPHIMSGFQSPRNVSHLRMFVWKCTPQEEHDTARSIRFFGKHLRCLAMSRNTGDPHMSTARLLDIMAKRAPGLVVLGVYEDIDYSRGENRRILRVLSRHLKNLQVFVWAPLHLGLEPDEDFSSSEEDPDGFSICSDDDENSLQKIERFARAVLAACSSLQYFISFRLGRQHGWLRGKDGIVHYAPPMCNVADNCFLHVDPTAPLDYFWDARIREPRLAYIPGKMTPANSPHFHRRRIDFRYF